MSNMTLKEFYEELSKLELRVAVESNTISRDHIPDEGPCLVAKAAKRAVFNLAIRLGINDMTCENCLQRKEGECKTNGNPIGDLRAINLCCEPRDP